MMSLTRKASFCRPFEIYFGTCPKSNKKSFRVLSLGVTIRSMRFKEFTRLTPRLDRSRSECQGPFTSELE